MSLQDAFSYYQVKKEEEKKSLFTLMCALSRELIKNHIHYSSSVCLYNVLFLVYVIKDLYSSFSLFLTFCRDDFLCSR